MGCGGSKTKGNFEKGKKYAYPKCKDTIHMTDITSALAPLDDKSIIVATDKGINKLDISSHQLTLVYNGHIGTINSIIKLKSGLYASAGTDKFIKIWDLSSNCKGTLEGHTSMIWSISECANGNLLSASDDKSSMLWDITKNSTIATLLKSPTEISSCVGLSDGRGAIGGGFKSVKIYNLSTKNMEGEIPMDCGIWSMIQLKDGRIAAGLGNGDIHIIDVATMKSVIQFKGHTRTVNCLIELNGGRIVSGSDDKNLIMWNLDDPTGKFILQDGHDQPICSLAKIDDFKFVSSSSSCIKIWE